MTHQLKQYVIDLMALALQFLYSSQNTFTSTNSTYQLICPSEGDRAGALAFLTNVKPPVVRDQRRESPSMSYVQGMYEGKPDKKPAVGLQESGEK